MVVLLFHIETRFFLGTVIGFNSAWKPERPFPIDMAAFAINITLILENPDAGFKYDVPRGYQAFFSIFFNII